MMSARHLEPRARARGLTVALALTMALLASGCRDHARIDDVSAARLNDPDKRHPIGYSRQTEALYVEVVASSDGLSPNQQADVWRFLERYKSQSSGPLKISAPSSVRGHLAVSRSVKHVEEMVSGAGIPRSAVLESRHQGATEFGPALKLAYERPVALAPACGDWPEDLGRDRERVHYDDFGCASQHNLAMMVANARDLRVPQEETSRSAERRDVIWSQYVGTEKTGSGGGGSGSGAGSGSGTGSSGPAIKN